MVPSGRFLRVNNPPTRFCLPKFSEKRPTKKLVAGESPSSFWRIKIAPKFRLSERYTSLLPISIGIGFPLSSKPIRRLKNGWIRMFPPDSSGFRLIPTPKREAFSRKNWRLSGKNTENLLTLFTWRSASAWAKSVLIVKSKMVLVLIAHFISPPTLKLVSSGFTEASYPE